MPKSQSIKNNSVILVISILLAIYVVISFTLKVEPSNKAINPDIANREKVSSKSETLNKESKQSNAANQKISDTIVQAENNSSSQDLDSDSLQHTNKEVKSNSEIILDSVDSDQVNDIERRREFRSRFNGISIDEFRRVSVHSAFKEEKTDSWGIDAELTLEQFAKDIKSNLEPYITVSAIICSDYVCYFGLNGDFKRFNYQFMRAEIMSIENKFFTTWFPFLDLVHVPGIYFLRYHPGSTIVEQ